MKKISLLFLALWSCVFFIAGCGGGGGSSQGGGGASRDSSASYAPASIAPPAVSSLSPAYGKAGSEITITGSGFSTGGSIKFASAQADEIVSWSDGQIICKVPAGCEDGMVTVCANGMENSYDKPFTALWTQRHNGPANNNDQINDLAVDKDGNVCAIGLEFFAYRRCNLWVRKTTSGGKILWTKTFNGSANFASMGLGIAVDSFCNIYITGREYNSNNSDVVVKKLDPSGAVLWSKVFGTYQDDAGEGIAVDSAGNVYVTGTFFNSSTDYDLFIRKYDANGNELWTKSFTSSGSRADTGKAVAVDSAGDVYVCGNTLISYEIFDAIILKYDANGKLLWNKIYDTGLPLSDTAEDLALSPDGNIVVTGIHKFNFLIPYAGGRIWTRKYDPSGNELWTQEHYPPYSARTSGESLAIDQSGNINVVGYENTNESSIFIRKYDTSGNVLWTQKYSGEDTYANYGYAAAVDARGNLYVGGTEMTSGQAMDCFLRKYDPNGNFAE